MIKPVITEKLQLKTITLTNLFVKYGIQQPFDFVNVDVQGSELEALKGFPEAWWEHVQVVYVELNTKAQYEGACAPAELDAFLFAKQEYENLIFEITRLCDRHQYRFTLPSSFKDMNRKYCGRLDPLYFIGHVESETGWARNTSFANSGVKSIPDNMPELEKMLKERFCEYKKFEQQVRGGCCVIS